MPRARVADALRLSQARLAGTDRFLRADRVARSVLDRCDLEIWPEDDYEPSDGRTLVKRWDRLVVSKLEIINALRDFVGQKRELERRRVRALRQGLGEFRDGGGPAFVAAARAWRDYELRIDTSDDADRLETALTHAQKVRRGLIKIADDSDDLSSLVVGIQNDYPHSSFAQDDGFAYIDED